jgi:3-methylfumaryl-CoA hydratase
VRNSGATVTEVDLQAWVGKTQTQMDRLYSYPAVALAATLDSLGCVAPKDGDALSPLWVWLYFLSLVPMAEVGGDGHPKRGGFLPPVPLDRRMWAGGRLKFNGSLVVGDHAERRSTILKISQKDGKTGAMVFVTLRHEIHQAGKLIIEEEQDLVYLPMPKAFTPPAPQLVPACDWRQSIKIDPVLLFRFSALTFNGHRIHYDLPYAQDIEKYPGLVVHGPLQAIMLFEAARRHAPDRVVTGFHFRAIRPLFDFDAVSLCGKALPDGFELFTVNGENAIGMQASMSWAP